ncbi:hypothetical protein BDF22DRAFT_693710 [Syncephalis plumigaleata]|nr:hypothetical protein BDF22DRAFT_693710 [Syncephalis plumigaleata]
MLRSKAHVHRNKKGNVVKVVKEHYLRDDIWCSSKVCKVCIYTTATSGASSSSNTTSPGPILSAVPDTTQRYPMPHYCLPDTNVFINQIDFIEHPALRNVIVLQTVLEESPVYNRLRAVISDPSRQFYVFSNEHHRSTFVEKLKDESPNDRNDRAIRVATRWYEQHLSEAANGSSTTPIRVVLITNDVDNRNKALQDSLLACSVSDYVTGMTNDAQIIDMVAQADTNNEGNDNVEKPFEYEEYLSNLQLTAGVKQGQLHQGTLSISTHNYLEGSIMSTVDGKEQTILILGRTHINRAVHGDVVVVRLLPTNAWRHSPSAVVTEEDEEKEQTENDDDMMISDDNTELQPCGVVVGIVKRNWRPYCGFIDVRTVNMNATNSWQNVLFMAMDRRIPKIRMRTRQAGTLLGQRLIVCIDSWARDSKYPSGHFVRALGRAGDKQTETEVLLLEHDVPYQPFSAQVLADLPTEGADWRVTDDRLANRTDLRHLNICSIDPPGCTDIDDALHLTPLPNGNYQVGVHIADVTSFVGAGTAMDTEAAARGTTVYLVDKRIDMLPALLGTNLCSLHCNVDRFAFSCIWEISPEAEIVNVDFTKSVIQSKASFTYEQAQQRIDNAEMQDDLTQSIRLLNELAKKLRAKRIERGALTLASPEVRFQLENDSQDPVDVEMKELKETNALVEEFMLLANISVAQKIYSHYPDCSMLRRHPTPPTSNFDKLFKAVAPFGISLDCTNSKTLADSLDLAILPSDPYFNKLIRIMTTRCMMQAVYFCSGTLAESDFRHYGLATDIYTHFTSPIRRYADVIVHRLLGACIGVEGYSSRFMEKKKMAELCDVLNYRHRMAQQASRSSIELYTHLFFKGKRVLEEGYVTRILKNGFLVLVPKYV